MTDWQTISSLATAAGTLVLAVATFTSVRTSSRATRIAESALLAGMRPLIVQSLADDPVQKVVWSDRHAVHLGGGRASVEDLDGVIYLAIGLRNVGAGIALLHGWYPIVDQELPRDPPSDADTFRRLTIDLYIAPGGSGYWEGAVREASDPVRPALARRIAEREPFTIDLLYGDQQGGQRTISRCRVMPGGEAGWYCQMARHWNLDRPAPR